MSTGKTRLCFEWALMVAQVHVLKKSLMMLRNSLEAVVNFLHRSSWYLKIDKMYWEPSAGVVKPQTNKLVFDIETHQIRFA